MIITRTPFRLTLGGGGTDLPSYYSRHGGFIFAAAINKYMFININRPVVDKKVRVKYTKTEIVENREELQHEIAREAMRIMDIENSIEIISLADVPAGTGLGSSSCYSVGLLNGLHTIKRKYILLKQLAEEACDLEINRLKKPIGKQDQYMATFGGLTVLEIDKNGSVEVHSAKISDSTIDDLNRNILMFYTSTFRSADEILVEQNAGALAQKSDVIESMHFIKDIGFKILDAVESGNVTKIGQMFDQHWQYKKRISTKISNSYFDEIYKLAIDNGAIGGKIAGAGGGGFFIFYVEENQKKLREAMKKIGLREMRYRFDFEGTKVLVNLMEDIH